jgi:hypothetical protein
MTPSHQNINLIENKIRFLGDHFGKKFNLLCAETSPYIIKMGFNWLAVI